MFMNRREGREGRKESRKEERKECPKVYLQFFGYSLN
jgi:hypothetical protein